MTLAHTERMESSASLSRTPARMAPRGGTSGFAAVLDTSGGAEDMRKAVRKPEPPADDKAPDKGASPGQAGLPARAAARREARTDDSRSAGRSADRNSGPQPRADAPAAETDRQAGQAAGSAQTASAQNPASATGQTGTAPDGGTVARLAGLVLDETGTDEPGKEATPEDASVAGTVPGAIPILPFLTVPVAAPPAASAGASAAARPIGGDGSLAPANPGLASGVAEAATDAPTDPGVAQGHTTALLLAGDKAGRRDRASEPGGPAGNGTEATRSEFKTDLVAALGETTPTPAPPLETPKVGHLQAAAAQQAAPAQQASAPSVPVGQVPMTIGLRSLAGSSQFEIRLDPAELGRIDVTLEINKERGTVMTHLVVERVDTLAMLQRDAGSLQQALSQAGLDASSDGGIRLSLRGDGSGQDQGQARSDTGGRDGQGRRGTWAAETPDAAEIAPLRTLRGLGSLDIRI